MRYLSFRPGFPAISIVSIISVFLILPVGASQSALSSVEPGSGTFFSDIGEDFRYLFSQPDFYQVIGGVGFAPKIFQLQFRTESPEFTEQWGSSNFANRFFEPGEVIGSAVFPLAAGAVALAFSNKRENGSIKDFGSDLIRAHFFNGLITLSMKQLVNRTRPDGKPYSFPSGHTSTAFTTAGVIFEHYGAKPGIPAFLVASYIGLSRLQENKHYMTDVVAGAVIGSYISFKISGRKRGEGNVSLYPAVISDSPGAAVSIRF